MWKKYLLIAMIVCMCLVSCDRIEKIIPSVQTTERVAVTTVSKPTQVQTTGHQHQYGDWYSIKNETCTEAGVWLRGCSECGHTEMKNIDATGHEYNKIDTYTYDLFVCEICNHSYREPKDTTMTWIDAAGDVYVVAGSLNVRNAINYDKASLVGTVKFADKLTRVRYNDLWTEITYGGVTCYVATKYVTADAGEVTFTDVEDVTVYVNVENTMYLRSYPYYNEGDDSNRLIAVKRGERLIKTEVSTNGKWIKVTYTYTPAATAENANPQPVTLIGYCRPGNVTTIKPSEVVTPTPVPTPQG